MSTQTSAERLAAMIARFWIEHGYAGIRCRLAPRPSHDRHYAYDVRSNIGRFGYPPRELAE